MQLVHWKQDAALLCRDDAIVGGWRGGGRCRSNQPTANQQPGKGWVEDDGRGAHGVTVTSSRRACQNSRLGGLEQVGQGTAGTGHALDFLPLRRWQFGEHV